MSKTTKDGFSILGLGAAVCVACCAGPILVFLGGLTIAGIASTRLIGTTGLILASIATIASLLVRRRRRETTCAVGAEPVTVELTSRRAGP